MPRSVVLVDAVRTPFGKAGSLYASTRADDLMVRALRGLLERNPKISPHQIDDVAIAAATQTGDQGMNLGRSVALLAGLPNSVPGYSVDRWCAGALTAVTTISGAIAMGAYDIAIAGGVEHMGNHPIGEGIDPNPRYFSEKIVDGDALSMGATALLREIELRAGQQQQVVIALPHQGPHHRGSHQSAMAGHKDSRGFFQVHGLFVMVVNFVTFFGYHGVALCKSQIGLNHLRN